MFKCEMCNKASVPKTPLNRVVVERRDVQYNNTLWNREKEEEYVKTTQGWEIVKEMNVCGKCKERI